MRSLRSRRPRRARRARADARCRSLRRERDATRARSRPRRGTGRRRRTTAPRTTTTTVTADDARPGHHTADRGPGRHGTADRTSAAADRAATPAARAVARRPARRASATAQQVITVAANGYGTSSATLTAYERGANGWTQVFGPWFAYVGRNGVAPAGEKREGDGRTPSGTYGFDFMFGVNPDPGVHYAFRRVTGTNIVWDDDPASANYNRWIDMNTAVGRREPGADVQHAVVLLRRGDRVQRRAHTRPRERDLPARVARELDRGLRRRADRPAALAVALARSGRSRRVIAIGTLAALTNS